MADPYNLDEKEFNVGSSMIKRKKKAADPAESNEMPSIRQSKKGTKPKALLDESNTE